MDYPTLQIPTTVIISGASKSGKTTFVLKLLNNLKCLFNKDFDKIIFCYTASQKAYGDLPSNIELCRGVPDFEQLKGTPEINKLLILDDLMTTMCKSSDLVELYTRDCHHENISTIFITQNLFHEGLRCSRVNSQCIILMKTVGDKLGIQTLAKQIYPGVSEYFMKAYNDATCKKYSYLIVDISMETPDNLRLRTNIFPDEWPIIIYIPKV